MSTLEKHYQKELEKRVRRALFRFVLILWGTVLIVNFVVLGVIFELANRGLWKAIDEAFDEEVVSPVVSPQILLQEPEASCDKVCSPACQEFFDAALATVASQKKSKALPKK